MKKETYDMIYGIPRNRLTYSTFALREQAAIMGLFFIEPLSFQFHTQGITPEFIFSNLYEQLQINYSGKFADTEQVLSDADEWVHKFICLNSMLQALIFARQYLTDNCATSISKIAKISGSIGFFELLAKGSFAFDKEALQNWRIPFSIERSTKNNIFATIRFNDAFTGRFNDDTTLPKNRENQLRANAKAMREQNEAETSYNSAVLGWYSEDSYSLSIAKSDLAYTIVSNFRTFDTSIKTLLRNVSKKEVNVREIRRLTKNVYKNLCKASEKSFKAIESNAPEAQRLDTLIHNFELERQYHFKLLNGLLAVRRDLEPYLPDEERPNLDKLLISVSDLPNAFGRNHMLELIYKELKDCDGLSPDKISDAQKTVHMLAYFFFPVMEKMYFHTAYQYERDQLEGKEAIHNMVETHARFCLENFESYQTLINYTDKSPVFSPIEPDSLTPAELDFLKDFFMKNYSYETYIRRNNYMLCSAYFGIPQYGYSRSDKVNDFIRESQKRNMDFFISTLPDLL